jgi:RNA polymerase sigma-70 factor (ECF subfamily)
MKPEPDERDDAVLRLTRRCAAPDVVDHAVQDTFFALWRQAGGDRGSGDVAAFIWGIGDWGQPCT